MIRHGVVLAAFVVVVWPGRVETQSAAPGSVLDRTTHYVTYFVQSFVNVVAEERYVQTANPSNPGPGKQRRELLSDFLLVKGQNANDWHQFRDVREVDGKPVADRERRLTELFLQPWDTALKQAARITSDGSRHNLINVGTINYPLIVMAFLQTHYRDRFEFSIGRLERDRGRPLRVISFREPAMRDTVLGGVRSSGRAWVDDASGRVMKTELVLRRGTQKFPYTITTSFAFDERLQLEVPVEMRDSYPGYLDMTGVATYGQFRTFQVRTAEEVQR
jgi:hypothetical protein